MTGPVQTTGNLRRRVLSLTRAFTTPLFADDYLAVLAPRWSALQTATVVSKRAETAGTATLAFRPASRWAGHRPGQYLRLGVELDGVRHWRAYTITAEPGLLSVTVKRTPGGVLSPYLVDELAVGATVFLGEIEGQFTLPDPLPERLLMISAGSGITPIWSLLGELERRAFAGGVVHIHAARTPDDVIFGAALRALHERLPGYTLHEHHSSARGRITPAQLAGIVPDWRERETFLSGPRAMLDAMEAHWAAAPGAGELRSERFQPVIGEGAGGAGGGTVAFRGSGRAAECEPGVSILVGAERAGEALPFGCRMGICHTCVCRLHAGRVRDLRTGEIEGEQGELIRTCVTAPDGAIELET